MGGGRTDCNPLHGGGDDGGAKAGVDARKDGGNEALAAQDANYTSASIEAHQRPCQDAGQRAHRHNVPRPGQPRALRKTEHLFRCIAIVCLGCALPWGSQGTVTLGEI